MAVKMTWISKQVSKCRAYLDNLGTFWRHRLEEGPVGRSQSSHQRLRWLVVTFVWEVVPEGLFCNADQTSYYKR